MQTSVLRLGFPVDLRRARRAVEGATRGDPAGSELWWATVTPHGPGTLHLRVVGSEVEAASWGDGAVWMQGQAPRLLGAEDRPEGFRPDTVLLRRLARRHPVRFGRTDRVFDALVPAILGQKVATRTAERSMARITAHFGELAPGPVPGPLRMRPRAEALAGLGSFRLHPLGVERQRAERIIAAAAQADRFEAAAAVGADRLEELLRATAGIGPWTIALVRTAALGDPDAVPPGDFHVPHAVCWALAGEARGSDERMLELLEPYRGHRGRVIALLYQAGVAAPRRGPRMQLLTVDGFDRADVLIRDRGPRGGGWRDRPTGPALGRRPPRP
jgi:3-methyladenine DNA glycosylase/8-oxoguanine DNA glycosylase